MSAGEALSGHPVADRPGTAAESASAGAGTTLDTTSPSGQRSIESVAQVLIMLTIGAAAGAGSFTHVHDVAATHGQTGWLAWADAVVLELMSIASGLELRRRKRCHAPVRFPMTVMMTAVVLSLSAQVIQAEQTAVGWVAAAIPALGFLVMVKLALAHATVSPSALVIPERPDLATDDGKDPGGTSAASATVLELRSAASSPDAALMVSNDSPTREAGGAKQPPTSGRQKNDPTVMALLPMARIAAAELDDQGRRISRQALAHSMRAHGHGISNARASSLLRALNSERSDPAKPGLRHVP